MDVTGLYWQVQRLPTGVLRLCFHTTTLGFAEEGRIRATVSVGPQSVLLDVEMGADQAVELGGVLKQLALEKTGEPS
jgi:hypothetical protein